MTVVIVVPNKWQTTSLDWTLSHPPPAWGDPWTHWAGRYDAVMAREKCSSRRVMVCDGTREKMQIPRRHFLIEGSTFVIQHRKMWSSRQIMLLRDIIWTVNQNNIEFVIYPYRISLRFYPSPWFIQLGSPRRFIWMRSWLIYPDGIPFADLSKLGSSLIHLDRILNCCFFSWLIYPDGYLTNVCQEAGLEPWHTVSRCLN